MATFNEVSAAVVLQEYARAAENAEREVSVAAYQGLENHQRLADIAVEARKAADKARENYGTVPEASEADTETVQGNDSVTGIETPLDMMSIASQDDRERVQSEPSNQKGSAILSLDKGKRPIVQDFEGRTKDVTLLEDEPGMISKDLEVKSHQLRDLERRMLYEDWEGFSERIKAW